MCKICQQRHRLGPCPSLASASGPRRVANRQLPAPSSGNSVEALGGEDQPIVYGTAKLVFYNRDGSTRDATPDELADFVRRSDVALRASFEQTAAAVSKVPFDKKAYQRELMRKRRAEQKDKPS
jgi:hypothetical protein